MKDRTEAQDPTPVNFPPHPGTITVDYVVKLWVNPAPDPDHANQLTVTFQPMEPVPWPIDPTPGDIYVMNGDITQFHLYIHDSSSYVFYGNGITLSSDTPPNDLDHYFDPKMVSTKHVAFKAQYIYEQWAHVDPVLLFITDSSIHILSKPTDPDILNPGDHPKLTSGG